MDIWKTQDIAAPLDTEIIEEERNGETLIRTLRFHSHTFEGMEIRPYAIYGRPAGLPAGARLPGLLHIHGGTQTASLEDVLFFARRGYAVLSFDWTGPTDRRDESITTLFPESVGSNANRGDDFTKGKVYHIVSIARRALTLLEREPEVDPDRLGVYGISWGGFSTWLVNGVDDRLTCAVPIYGIGTGRLADRVGGWHETLLPIHFAPHQRSPVMFLDGTNDFFGQIPAMEEVMAALSVPARRSLSPNENHGLDHWVREAGWRWIDWRLKDGPPVAPRPRIEMREESGRLVARARAPRADACRLFYALGDAAPHRLAWDHVPMRTAGDAFEADVPTMSPASRVRFFANAEYDGAYRLSTAVLDAPAERFPDGSPRLPPTDSLFEPADGPDAWYFSYVGGAVMMTPAECRLESAVSALDERPCLALRQSPDSSRAFRCFLRAPASPRRRGGDAAGLRVEINPGGAREVSIELYVEDTPNTFSAKPYTFTHAFGQEAGWAVLTPAAADFRKDDGETLSDMGSVLELGLRVRLTSGAGPAEIGDIRWVR